MEKDRLAAFSDGVIAIIITIMVLELKAPHEPTLEALYLLAPQFLSYLLSFIYVGIYWNNHHHMLHTVKHVNGGILWANIHLLFWLSLVPFTTSWMGENHFARIPVAIYGVSLLMPAIAYYILSGSIIRFQGRSSALAHAIGRDIKGKVSIAIYIAAIILALYNQVWGANLCYILVALMWLVPDKRIERDLR